MNREPVVSSNIRSVGYDAMQNLLEIEFHSGGIYHYHGVPESRYFGLMSAPSKGTYFAQYIKNVFAYSRII